MATPGGGNVSGLTFGNAAKSNARILVSETSLVQATLRSPIRMPVNPVPLAARRARANLPKQ
jgi:hypothetical protein